jgi:hypothetical protein
MRLHGRINVSMDLDTERNAAHKFSFVIGGIAAVE